MAEPLVLNTIERLGRALFATLAPATGVRATGYVEVTNSTGGTGNDAIIPPNTYMIPVVGGSLREDLVFKTLSRPPESMPGGGGDDRLEGGGWLVNAGSSAQIAITSNVGGARHNLPVGTIFRFDPLITDIAPTATLVEATTGGSNAGQLIESVGFFEDLQGADPGQDLFAAKVGDAGVLLVWTQSEPVEGGMSGMRQGATRATRSARFWRESFVLYVVASRLAAENARRQNGQLILQAVTRLLTNRHRNDDGETLSTVGAGVEITHRARLGRNERHYIYALTLRVNQTLEQALDARTFTPWESTRYVSTPEDLEVVDATDPMP